MKKHFTIKKFLLFGEKIDCTLDLNNYQDIGNDANSLCYKYLDSIKTPKEKQLKKNNICLSIVIIFVIMTCIFSKVTTITEKGLSLKSLEDINFNNDSYKIISTIITVSSIFFSFMLESRKNFKAKADEEISLKKLYFSEFNDLIRHLEANLRVVVQIRMEMEENVKLEKPMEIHFENLKWPEDSILFQEKIATIIDHSNIENFSRLRLNIRNMNNSAVWLKEYCKNKDYTKENMIKMLDWEIWRIIKYYTIFSYMSENRFNYPNQKQVLLYYSRNKVNNKLNKLFENHSKVKKVKEIINEHIKLFLNDKMREKNIIFY